jgi:hypothetical protein
MPSGSRRGRLIAVLFFRRAPFMAIAAGPPLIAILLGLGALGSLDFRLNLFLNIITPLIMVISFSDSMQLAARDRLVAGESRYDAFRNSLLIVGGQKQTSASYQGEVCPIPIAAIS